MKIDQDRGWKTIAGWIITAAGGLLFALASTGYALVDEKTAGGIIAIGVAWAGIGDRDAKAKQIRTSRYAATQIATWTRTAAGLARAVAKPKPAAKPGRR